MRLLKRDLLFHLLLVLLVALPAAAQERRELTAKEKELAEFVKANYTKSEFMVPVRDGVRLFTCVYVPKDASATNPYPIMFDRTPYSVSPYGPENYKVVLGPTELFTRGKYIFVYQDVRGAFMSEGEFVDMRPEDAAEKAAKRWTSPPTPTTASSGC